MGDFVKRGGYVVTTPQRNYVGNRDVDQATLEKIIVLLGIGQAHRDELTAESIRTISIYAKS